MVNLLIIFLSLFFLNTNSFAEISGARSVDTAQDKCYGSAGEISCPTRQEGFYGVDAQYLGYAPSYKDNKNQTVTDLNTGLMWSKDVDSKKVSLNEAKVIAKEMKLAGFFDWRVPNIKELYSLIDFRGYTGFSLGDKSSIPSNCIPFINTDYFGFRYGQVDLGERYIDGQWLSSTKYVSTTMDGAHTLFGVNFVDGRIKGYGYKMPGRNREKKFYARYVRGAAYGDNDFVDNADATITDVATGLTWMKDDSNVAMSWKDALKYAQNLEVAGFNDWRLPNAKELQYIVDYSRSPDTTDSPAIDPIFQTTVITNEAGEKDYPYVWTSTTHCDGPHPGSSAVYVAFGRALGKMHGKIMDVHGAGAQRSDPKTGSPTFRGPQGDVLRIKNFVRCVRGGDVVLQKNIDSKDRSKYPYYIKVLSIPSTNKKRGRLILDSKNTRKGRFVQRLDRNGDGKVSRTEFDGPKHHFGTLDKDGDGYLSEDEAPKFPLQRRGSK